MSMRAIGDALIMTALAAGAGWIGYRHRREYWTRQSWIGFGLAMLGAFAMLGFALYFSAEVGQPWTGARGSNTRSAWIVLTLGCLTGGVTLATIGLMWFARGDPEKQFTLLRLTRTTRAFLRESPAERLAHLPLSTNDVAEARADRK
jgi:hypothetical protein